MATNILKRNQPGNETQDLGAIGNLTYNQAAGATKVADFGRHLLPLVTPGVGTGYTTNVSSAAFPLPGAGRNLAVYNNSGTIASITFGMDNTVASLSAGTTDSSGRVGLACMPNAWSYFAAGYSSWVISSASTVLVYLINDNTSIQVQAPGIQNNYGFPGSSP